MEHFVAYHSVKQMGRPYEPDGTLRFLSKKVGLLRKAIGGTVWVVQGSPIGNRTQYSLMGAYEAASFEELAEEPGVYLLSGTHGRDFSPPIALNDRPWFQALQRSQSNFSLGFNRVSDPAVVRALTELAERQPELNRADRELTDLDLNVAGVEGAQKLVSHLRCERNRALVERKKAAVLHSAGRLACEACGFDFTRTYGDWGKDYCEVHHTVPLATITSPTHTRLEDLAVLCSNCHRVIHRVSPMPSVKALADRLRRRGA